MTYPTPRMIVDQQLVAYNAHDIDAYMALFAPDAVISELASGAEIVRGEAAIRSFYTARFSDNPELRCEVFSHTDLGDFAIDREQVLGLPNGPLQLIAIYEVREGLIRSLRFIRE
ncbi:MAG: nuclear transport factor 2 family protein [Elsteraceae bacterium]